MSIGASDIITALVLGIVALALVSLRGRREGTMPSEVAIRHITDPYSDQRRY